MDTHAKEQLSDYADGHLDPGTRRRVEAHLECCADCRQALEGIRRVAAWAPAYEGSAPPGDLWGSIASRLDRPAGAPVPARWHGRRISVRLPLLAAAAVALIVTGAALTRLFQGSPAAPGVAVIQVRSWSPEREVATRDAYDAAITELETTLASNATALDPATLAVIRESLAAIDVAIGEARRAIADDSTNDYLNASIAQHMRRKLGILRKAAQAAAAQS